MFSPLGACSGPSMTFFVAMSQVGTHALRIEAFVGRGINSKEQGNSRRNPYNTILVREGTPESNALDMGTLQPRGGSEPGLLASVARTSANSHKPPCRCNKPAGYRTCTKFWGHCRKGRHYAAEGAVAAAAAAAVQNDGGVAR